MTAGGSSQDPATGGGELTELRGTGFIPEEGVAVAVVVRLVQADDDGAVRALVAAEAPQGAVGVLLFGQVSGTVVAGAQLR